MESNSANGQLFTLYPGEGRGHRPTIANKFIMASTKNQGPSTRRKGVLIYLGTQLLALRRKALVVVWLLVTLLSVCTEDTLSRFATSVSFGGTVLGSDTSAGQSQLAAKKKRRPVKRRIDKTASCDAAGTGGTPAAAAVEEAQAGGGDVASRTISLDSDEPMIESNSNHGDSEEEVLSSGSSSHEGTAKVGMALLPARLKPLPVALQVLPLGVNARLRWDRLHLSLSVKSQVNTVLLSSRLRRMTCLGLFWVQDNPYKKLTMTQTNYIRNELIKHPKAIIDQ